MKELALPTIIDAGIRESFFPTPDHAHVYKWMVEYYKDYGESPTTKAFRQNFPSYKLVVVEEPLQFLIDQLREQRKMAIVEETLLGTVEKRKDGEHADDLLKFVATKVNEIHSEVSEMKDLNLIETWESRLALYDELKSLQGGMRGIPLGFPAIDEITAGLQGGQLTTLIGAPKMGKSTMLLRMAINAHEFGASVLVVTFEMSNAEQAERADSMRTRVPLKKLRRGTLSEAEERKMRKGLKRIADDYPHPFILSQDVYSATTLSGILAKVQQHRPDVLFIDGVYMMDDEQGESPGSPRHLTNITRGLKRMAQQLNIPIMITTQVLTWKLGKIKGKQTTKLDADSIGYSSSFAQDSDLVLGVEPHPANEDFKKIRILLSRNTETTDITIRWDWNFGTFEETEDPSEGEDFDDDDEEGAYGLRDSH